MRSRLAALALGLAILPLPLAAEAAQNTIASYQAMSVEQRVIYIAGLADMLDMAAALAPDNSHLPVLAECTNGFGRGELLSALEAGATQTASQWTTDAPAAVWFVDTMIYVCQLQLAPLRH